MNALQRLTETAIRAAAGQEVYARGKAYFDDGAVLSLILREGVLQARVQGTESAPYQLTVKEDESGALATTCTCPYDWDGLCKHLVAVLLTCVNKPEEIVERPSLKSLLEPLERDRLQAMLLFLAERRPELEDLIEGLATARALPGDAGDAVAPQAPPAISAAELKQVRATVQRSLGSGNYGRGYGYDDHANVAREIETVADQARPYLDAEDGRSALTLLETVLVELSDGSDSLYDEDGSAYELGQTLGALLAEALLAADPTREERREWAAKIKSWQRAVSEYGMEDGLDVAQQAAREGWDDPGLVRVLAGESEVLETDALTEEEEDESAEDEGGEQEDEELEDEEYDDEEDGDEFAETSWRDDASYDGASLSLIRLEILRRRERWPEYLRLAQASGQNHLYGTALIELGRVEEAIEYGLTGLHSRDQALTLCQALEAAGAVEPALRVAEQVIDTVDERGFHRATLVLWARDLAERLGFPERALAAAKTALREQTNLANYLAAQRLAGETWPELREETLIRLRAYRGYEYTTERVDIFLHEGLVDDAIAVVDSYEGHGLVARVTEAAKATHPDWVFRACVHQFDRIADRGAAQYYDAAAEWLARARDALVAAGRTGEWRQYLEGAIQKHQRKYKLRPMLEALRLK